MKIFEDAIAEVAAHEKEVWAQLGFLVYAFDVGRVESECIAVFKVISRCIHLRCGNILLPQGLA